MKVVKFGGSSLANAEQFKKVGDIIRADRSRRYVIPSAPGKRFSGDTKVTDLLYKMEAEAAAGEDFSETFNEIKSRFTEIIEGLELKDFSLDDQFDEIWKRMKEDPDADYAASRGEHLNGRIMAQYLGFEFVDPFEMIFFDDEGSLDDRKTMRTVEKRLAGVEYAVVPGFYGCSHDGKVKAFSRGGSDITGSIVAGACHADVYENWTDVSGFLVADPRIIKNPARIETITYRELRELSYMGEGTWIVESTAQKSGYVITGIAGRKDFCAVLITKDMMNSEIGFGRKVLQAFEDNQISFEHMPSGIDTMTIVVHEDEFIEKEQKVVSAIHRLAKPDSIEIESDLALIAVVGRGMKSMRGTAGRIFSALAHAHVNVRMIDQGSSELNIIIGVENKDFETALQAIYDIFVLTQL